jgi:hypothetical protein
MDKTVIELSSEDDSCSDEYESTLLNDRREWPKEIRGTLKLGPLETCRYYRFYLNETNKCFWIDKYFLTKKARRLIESMTLGNVIKVTYYRCRRGHIIVTNLDDHRTHTSVGLFLIELMTLRL